MARNGRDEQTSVDHFIPKSVAPTRAYDWDNYRLCRAKLNHRKADTVELIDPMYVTDGWFSLDFSTFLIVPAVGLPAWVHSRVSTSIDILGLNEDDYVNQRVSVIRSYVLDQVPYIDLAVRYPFIASQMTRQQFDTSLKPAMSSYFSNPR